MAKVFAFKACSQWPWRLKFFLEATTVGQAVWVKIGIWMLVHAVQLHPKISDRSIHLCIAQPWQTGVDFTWPNEAACPLNNVFFYIMLSINMCSKSNEYGCRTWPHDCRRWVLEANQKHHRRCCWQDPWANSYQLKDVGLRAIYHGCGLIWKKRWQNKWIKLYLQYWMPK